MQEASLLMAKLNYVEGNYREALSNYFKVGLDDLQLVGIPVYRLSMIAEAYATKGLCLEKVPMASPVNRHTGGEQEIITCYEKSGDIALLYLQEVEKALSSGMQNRSPKPGPVSHEQELGFFLETGLQRAHVIYFKNGNLTRGVGRFREILRAIETRTTQNLRMANRDAVLSRIPEHNNDRIISLQSSSIVYDLLTIALGRRGQYEMLSECLERAMKFAFEEFHLWYQFALSLMAAGKSARAVKVLKECIRLKPDDPTIPLLAVKLCIGTMHWLEEGERFAKMVIDMGEKASEFRAKGYLAIGLVYSLKATDASLRGVQEEYQRKALGAFQRAQSLSPTDHLAAFYLALQHAVSRQLMCDQHFITPLKLPAESHANGLQFKHGLSNYIGAQIERPRSSDGSVHATSIAASRVEQALSEVASSLQSSAPKQGPLHPWMTLAQIWLHAAEVYTGIGKPAEATACTQEAANLFPTSHNVLFMRGQVAELRGNTDEAKRWYEEALSISPTHVKTMQRLV
ncbi:UNVERIFIED_CONTAM: hypothetical protein FKN15_060382 [Acipenser sinensis]